MARKGFHAEADEMKEALKLTTTQSESWWSLHFVSLFGVLGEG